MEEKEPTVLEEIMRILTGAMLDLLSQMYSELSIINKALNTSLEGLTRS